MRRSPSAPAVHHSSSPTGAVRGHAYACGPCCPPPGASFARPWRSRRLPLCLSWSCRRAPSPGRPPSSSPRSRPVRGSLAQLSGKLGCVVDKSVKKKNGCASARALNEPGPFMGSRAIAISPDGRNVYVASSASDAIAIFFRNPNTGALKQHSGLAGCVAAKGEAGCAPAIGLDAPNSVAVSPDGRNVYVTSRDSSTVTMFARDPEVRRPGSDRRRLRLRAGAARLHGRAGPARARRPRRQPRRQQRLRRLLLRQRDRRLQPRSLDRRPRPARGRDRLRRRNDRGRLRPRDRPQIPRGDGDQRRRHQRLRRDRPLQRARRLLARPLDGGARPGDERQRLHRRDARSPAAPPASSWPAPTRSRSAPTTKAST